MCPYQQLIAVHDGIDAVRDDKQRAPVLAPTIPSHSPPHCVLTMQHQAMRIHLHADKAAWHSAPFAGKIHEAKGVASTYDWLSFATNHSGQKAIAQPRRWMRYL